MAIGGCIWPQPYIQPDKAKQNSPFIFLFYFWDVFRNTHLLANWVPNYQWCFFFFFFNEMSAYVLGLKQCLHVGHAFFSFF